MSRTSVVALLLVFGVPIPSLAQRIGTNVEVFGTASLVAGVTPITAPSGSKVSAHAGVRGDIGVEFGHIGAGLGLRYWEMPPTSEFGGRGFDVFLIGEWRADYSSRTTLRSALGYGFDDFDSGHGPERPTLSTEGVTMSIGIGRQVIAPRDIPLALTADLVIPQPKSGAFGRRRPVLEIGVGHRFSDFHPVIPLP